MAKSALGKGGNVAGGVGSMAGAGKRKSNLANLL